MSNRRPREREPLTALKEYPAFQNLRAKAETHQREFRPEETKRLEKNGQLDQVLDERTESCWNTLADCRAAGMHMNEAEEIALPTILLPSETEQTESQ
jgi:hypothetical protein